MGLSYSRVSVTTSPTILTVIALDGGRSGKAVCIQNPSGGATVYLGDASVTTSVYGYALAGGSDFVIELEKQEDIYGIVASSAQTVNVMRQGV